MERVFLSLSVYCMICTSTKIGECHYILAGDIYQKYQFTKRIFLYMKVDWHKADIIAALRKKGTTMAALSRNVGLSSNTLANTISRPWPKGEYVIASALGIHPAEIWPSRYYDAKDKMIDRFAMIRKSRCQGLSFYQCYIG